MRIIGGDLKGRRLISVPGAGTRPTADRLRESIFNIISRYVPHAVVLDLFAGTGALGIEALSRGARHAVFVDRHKKALIVVEKNIRTCGFEKSAKTIQWDIVRNLNCLNGIQPPFSLVMMDPPYGRNMVDPVLGHLHRIGCLEKKALLVIEHTPDEAVDADPSAYTIFDQRKYGKTLVSFLRYMV